MVSFRISQGKESDIPLFMCSALFSPRSCFVPGLLGQGAGMATNHSSEIVL